MSKDGLHFNSIDDHEVHNLRILLNYTFNTSNYIDTFSWQKTTTPPNLSSKTKKSCEYILAFHNGNCLTLTGIQKISKSSNGLMNQTNNYGILTFPEKITTTSRLKNGIYKAGKYGTSSYDIELLEDTEVLNGIFIKPVKLKGRFKWGQTYLNTAIQSGTKVMIQTDAFSPSYEKDEYEPEKPWNIINSSFNVGTNENASSELDDMFTKNFSESLYPKPVSLIKYLTNFKKDNSLVLDYFAGSGTTAHAVINLNREDGGKRKYILVEQGEYFDTVLKPRVQKVVYAENWKDGKPQADKESSLHGVPQIVKVLKLESYEDTLNNLVLKDNGDLFNQLNDGVKFDPLATCQQAQQRCRGSTRGYITPARGFARSVAKRWALGDRYGKPPHQHARARVSGPTNVAPGGCAGAVRRGIEPCRRHPAAHDPENDLRRGHPHPVAGLGHPAPGRLARPQAHSQLPLPGSATVRRALPRRGHPQRGLPASLVDGALAGSDASPTGSPSGGAIRAAIAPGVLRAERALAVFRGRRHRWRPLIRLRALRPAAGRVGARSHPEDVFRDQ
ncbi:DNA methyltransferase [Eikenella corrodens]|uniref:DNA methyltransferase n=1 Tax=Eikenella corrodens TaxID=539 RepID=UPI00195EFEBB|nr:DNA methyltransferase [Eikenella corrodens]